MSIIKRLDHLAIGVKDTANAKRVFLNILEGEPLPDQGSSDEGFDWFQFMLGGKKLELVTPHRVGEGGVGRYVAKRGEGYHHISVAVDNLHAAIEYFRSQGLRVIGENRSIPDFQHCYLHPLDTCGAMIQVFEEDPELRPAD